MSDRAWLEVISRISASAPIDLDSLLFDKKVVDIEDLVADQGADRMSTVKGMRGQLPPGVP